MKHVDNDKNGGEVHLAHLLCLEVGLASVTGQAAAEMEVELG